jgi:hypothetical protein
MMQRLRKKTLSFKPVKISEITLGIEGYVSRIIKTHKTCLKHFSRATYTHRADK